MNIHKELKNILNLQDRIDIINGDKENNIFNSIKYFKNNIVDIEFDIFNKIKENLVIDSSYIDKEEDIKSFNLLKSCKEKISTLRNDVNLLQDELNIEYGKIYDFAKDEKIKEVTVTYNGHDYSFNLKPVEKYDFIDKRMPEQTLQEMFDKHLNSIENKNNFLFYALDNGFDSNNIVKLEKFVYLESLMDTWLSLINPDDYMNLISLKILSYHRINKVVISDNSKCNLTVGNENYKVDLLDIKKHSIAGGKFDYHNNIKVFSFINPDIDTHHNKYHTIYDINLAKLPSLIKLVKLNESAHFHNEFLNKIIFVHEIKEPKYKIIS